MIKIKPFLPWPGADERAVVADMIRDTDSPHWKECWNFVKFCVLAKAKNIPVDLHEDIAQEVMYKVMKFLPYFRSECTLRTWVNLIVEHCIIDAHRKLQNVEQFHFSLTDQSNEGVQEGESFTPNEEKSAEDAFIINDEIRGGWEALLEYANAHSNPIRDRLLIRMVIFEGQTHREAAIVAGCNAPVVGYVVREAQHYAREKMGHKL